MNSLAQRKQLLVLQSDLQRQLIRAECRRWQEGLDRVGEGWRAHRWWLIGGGLMAGWLLTRRLPSLARWLPLAAPAWRLARGWLAR